MAEENKGADDINTEDLDLIEDQDGDDNDSGDGDDPDAGDDKPGDDGDDDADGGKKGDPSFLEAVEAIEDKAVRKFASRSLTIADLAKRAFEGEQEISKRIKPPGKKATEDDIKKYHKAIGVPEDTSGYEIMPPEHLDEETFESEPVQERIGVFLDVMHKSGAPKQATEAALDVYWLMEAEAKAAQEKSDQDAIDAAEAAMRKDWGEDYDRNVALGAAYFEKQGGIELGQLELEDGTLLESHPAFIKFGATAGRRMGEGDLQMGLGGTDAGADLEKLSNELTVKIHAANAKGDNDEAVRLSRERRTVLSQLTGIEEDAA